MAVDAKSDLRAHPRGDPQRAPDAVLADAGFKRASTSSTASDDLSAGRAPLRAGLRPVKGFAVTLSIGVLTSLFSDILVTRLQSCCGSSVSGRSLLL